MHRVRSPRPLRKCRRVSISATTLTSRPIESDSVLTMVVIESAGAGASRVGRVHGVMTLKNIGFPRYDAASTLSVALGMSGNGPSQAERTSDWLRGSHRGSTRWNVDGVKPAAANNGVQSGGGDDASVLVDLRRNGMELGEPAVRIEKREPHAGQHEWRIGSAREKVVRRRYHRRRAGAIPEIHGVGAARRQGGAHIVDRPIASAPTRKNHGGTPSHASRRRALHRIQSAGASPARDR